MASELVGFSSLMSRMSRNLSQLSYDDVIQLWNCYYCHYILSNILKLHDHTHWLTHSIIHWLTHSSIKRLGTTSRYSIPLKHILKLKILISKFQEKPEKRNFSLVFKMAAVKYGGLFLKGRPTSYIFWALVFLTDFAFEEKWSIGNDISHNFYIQSFSLSLIVVSIIGHHTLPLDLSRVFCCSG